MFYVGKRSNKRNSDMVTAKTAGIFFSPYCLRDLFYCRFLCLFLLNALYLPYSCCMIFPLRHVYSPFLFSMSTVSSYSLRLPILHFIKSPSLPLQRANLHIPFQNAVCLSPVSDVTRVFPSLHWSCGVSREALTYRNLYSSRHF